MIRTWVLWMVALSAVGVATTTCIAWGATYNFYFNNVEQGPNGQASPSVTIQDGKLQNGTAQTLPEAEPTPSPTPATDVAAPTPPANPDAVPAKEPGTENEPTVTSASAEVATAVPQKRAKNWRFDLTALTAVGGGVNGTLGALFGFTWNPHPAIGFRGLAGGALQDRYRTYSGYYGSAYSGSSYSGYNYSGGGTYTSTYVERQFVPVFGAEAEWNPIRVNFWGLEDWFAMGAVLGFSTIPSGEVNWAAIHTGLRIRMNLSENLGLLAQTRFNDQFASFEAGLTLGI